MPNNNSIITFKKNFIEYCLWAGMPIILIFAALNYLSGNMNGCIADILLFVSLFALYYILVTVKNYIHVYRFAVTILLVHFIFHVYTGESSGASAMMSFVFPLISLILLGTREGMSWTAMYFIICLIIFIFPHNFGAYVYHKDFIIYFLASFLLASVFSYGIEKTHQAYHERLESELTERQKLYDNTLNLLEAKEALIKELYLKETLIKETHHRVSNNLSIIQTLMTLESSKSNNTTIKNIFNENASRVLTMSRIHEMLYESSDLSSIDFADYLRSLVNNIYDNYCINKHITIKVDIQKVSINVKTIIPCGLIVNELMTNAFKYAFPEGQKGEVFVGVQSNEDNLISLVVRDNGVGLPENFDLEKTESLGLTIVNSLVGQINGNLEIVNKNGAEFNITFTERNIA
ncbi:sensor histidine kinase [Nitrospirota bacterium]